MRIHTFQLGLISFVLEAILMRKSASPDNHDDDETGNFITDDLPPVGVKVEVVGCVGSARHVIPFVCCWTEEGWVVAGTRRKLAFNVEGWRRVGV